MAGANAHRGSFVGRGRRLIAQRSSAVRTVGIIYASQALALRTARARFEQQNEANGSSQEAGQR
jgi:hypothetical protein